MARRTIEAAIFVGPSLRQNDLAELPPEFEVLPPAAQGDVYRLSQFAPKVIALVDGFFHTMPAVWHKEILWAMAQGIIVVGASSMGALRAAELARYGMIGIGDVYEAFATGSLEDDDEVAVVHGPPRFGYPPLSEALVNIRATLDAALTVGVIDERRRTSMLLHAKELPFYTRSYQKLLKETEKTEPFLDRGMTSWIMANQVDVKRKDAQRLVFHCSELLKKDENATGLQDRFDFQYTTMWHEVRRKHLALNDEAFVGMHEIVEEIALKGQGFAEKAGIFPIATFNGCELDFTEWTEGESLRQPHDAWMRGVVDPLKANGVYEKLVNRAINKKRKQQEFGPSKPLNDAFAVVSSHFHSLDELPAWSQAANGAGSPDERLWNELDLYSRSLGLQKGDDLIRAILRESIYGVGL